MILIFAAAIAGAVTVPLDSAPAYAVAHNPQLAAARLRIDEARGRLRQAGRFANPELEAEYRQNVRTSENAFDFAFKQKFPVTGRLRLEKAISAAQLAAAEAEVRDAARRTAAEARTAAVQYLAARDRRALLGKQLANSRELTDFMAKRVQLGEAPVTDAQQVDLEGAQLTAEILRLEAEQAAAVAALRPLLGVAAQATVEITGTLAEPNPGDWRGKSGERPDLTAAQEQARAAQQEAELAKAQRWEDIEVGLLAGYDRAEDAPDGLQKDTMVGVRLSLPLPFWNRNEGRIAEAQAAAARAREEASAMAARLDAEAAGTRAELRALAKLAVQLDAVLLPKADQIEGQLRVAYGNGQASLTDVLRARDQRLQLRRQQLDALRDYHLALTRHAAATGTILPSQPSSKK
jgi:cobalt-zinc-cadmium efflux system outer membrane protein